MIAVVAAVGGKIERNRQAFLTGGQIAPVEGVGILRRRKAGILADRPWLGDVHGRVGAPQERRDARIAIEAVEPGERCGVIGVFDADAFGRLPRRGLRRRCGWRVGIGNL